MASEFGRGEFENVKDVDEGDVAKVEVVDGQCEQATERARPSGHRVQGEPKFPFRGLHRRNG